jgi:hypothetical protein
VRLRLDESALTAAIVALAGRFGRYGYKCITGLLQMAARHVNQERVQSVWRAEGPKVPKRESKRGRLWLADGFCVRLRPQHANHVWAYDLVSEPGQEPAPQPGPAPGGQITMIQRRRMEGLGQTREHGW